MNDILRKIEDSGDVTNKRTLQYFVEGESVAFVTEYHMNSELGPFKWYLTWKDVNQHDKLKLGFASIMVNNARARLYFPAFLDTRIPPENREDLADILDKYNLDHYDKFDLIIATEAKSPIKAGYVKEISNVNCPFDKIHAIDEIYREYKRTLI